MLKALVLFALCVCAFGFGVFTPHMDVAFHASFDEDGYIWEGYIVQFGGTVYYTRELYVGETYLVRCDIHPAQHQCFVKHTEDSSSEPECFSEYPWVLRDVYYYPFNYITATAAACPDGVSDGCMNYTNEYGNTLTADSRNRVVMYVEENIKMQRDFSVSRITYHDDVPTVDMFADTDCEGEALQAPTPFDTVSLKDIGCAFSFTLDGVFGQEDVRGYKEGNDVKFLMVNTSSAYQLIARCDVEGCYGEEYSEQGTCDSVPPPIYVLNSILPQGEFNYVGEAESVSCSEDGPAECMKYTSPDEDYIIVDSQSRIVVRGLPNSVVIRGLKHSVKHSVIRSHKRAAQYMVITVEYHDEEPNIEIFDNLKCNQTALPPAEFTCPPPPPSSSSTKPVDPSSSTKPVDPSSSAKPVTPSSGSHAVSSSSKTNIAAILVVGVFIVALL